MKILGIIPARYASSRFPGKPLVEIAGKSMIHRVFEQASKASSLAKVLVATDDQRIFDHVTSFGGKVLMTSALHRSGTDRCAEVVELESGEWDFVVNIQGDEPFIQPGQIDILCRCFNKSHVSIATLVKKITDILELDDPNVVKAVINRNSEAIYFSRFPIPYSRNNPKEERLEKHTYYKHIGIYGYESETLKKLSLLESSSLESAESLEQLRWIENGYAIQVGITTLESISIDSPEDLSKLT